MRQVSYLTMGLNRGTPRLWLEGRRLAAAGFEKGVTYRVEANADNWSLRLVVDPAGHRRVSGKKRKDSEIPIIDLCDASLAPAGTRVRAVIADGEVVVTIHHEEANRRAREAGVAAAINGDRPLREATICAGFGISTSAIHQGLREAGIDSVIDWIVDMEPRYLDQADRVAPGIEPETQFFVGTVEEVEPSLVTPVDVVSLSLPCNTHSKAGKSKHGIKRAEDVGSAATSLFGAVALIRASNPAVVVSENVTEARSSTTYVLLRHELQRLGYCIVEVELDEAQAGSVERRRRYFFVAVSEGLAASGFDLEAAIPRYGRDYARLADMLEPVAEDDPMWTTRPYLDAKEVRDREAGKGFARQLLTPEDTSYGSVGRGYAKQRSTEPFLFREDGKERLLTPVEHARGKGIPECFVHGEVNTIAHEGLGQSGLWNHFRGLGHAVGNFLLGRAEASPVLPGRTFDVESSEPADLAVTAGELPDPEPREDQLELSL